MCLVGVWIEPSAITTNLLTPLVRATSSYLVGDAGDTNVDLMLPPSAPHSYTSEGPQLNSHTKRKVYSSHVGILELDSQHNRVMRKLRRPNQLTHRHQTIFPLACAK